MGTWNQPRYGLPHGQAVQVWGDGDVVDGQSAGTPSGHTTLDAQRDEIIKRAISAFYLKPTRPPFSRLVRRIQADCLSLGLKTPNWRTIKARVENIDLKTRGKKRGELDVLKATTAVPGQYRASRPLEVVQIDHTRVDVFVVDEGTREPVGRPWITVALDVLTRMVVGFHLTMEAPSRLSVSLCLLHSVFDKTAWLKEREIDAAWPVAGLPEAFTPTTARIFAAAPSCAPAATKA